MTAKALTADQCKTLHQFYPPPDCCICNARFEVFGLKDKIYSLEAEIAALHKVVDAARIFVMDIDKVVQTTRSERRLANKLDELDAKHPYYVILPPERTDLDGKPVFGEPHSECKKCGGLIPDDGECCGDEIDF